MKADRPHRVMFQRLGEPVDDGYTTRRVGGGVQNPDAMKALRVAAS